MPAVETVLTMAPAVLEHARQHGPAHEERPRQVDRDDLVPTAQRLLGRVGEPADAGDVAQVGDGAQLLAGLRHGRGDGVLVRDVAAQRDGPPAGLGGLDVDLRRHGLDGIGGDVEAGHGGALGGQPARRGPPDARTRAGDHAPPGRV